ncbi:hypothetical protein ROHU_001748 [Labeo rohita]|uniref:Uncharacterized protein n=1 Tax=Labeo rohita TaxID=84645 RepID=A0A498NZQ0_LABRO|nr:hypothetical protein ROHU_001748 [Labeo rohita]
MDRSRTPQGARQLRYRHPAPINKSGSPRPLRISPSGRKAKFHSSLQGLGQSAHGPQRSLLYIRMQQKAVSELGPRPECRGRQPPPSFSIIRAGDRCSCRRRAGHRLYKPPR